MAQPPTYPEKATEASPTALQRPLVLPQTKNASQAPFLRATSSELTSAGVEQAPFLAFLDDLNAAIAPTSARENVRTGTHVASRILPGVGTIVRSVVDRSVVGPSADAQANVASILASANRQLFDERGLHVSVETTSQLNSRLGVTAAPNISGLDALQRLAPYAGRVAPLDAVLDDLSAASAPASRAEERDERRAKRAEKRGHATDVWVGQWLVVSRV
ncbi:uncharacterized protein LOC62_02G002680 [Vanrija pseudolonga]|uniref:Uncharacterized protein n=1 Tax=Vanrija pseudolonga TaxID=143232 RepID=A0AAF0Y2S0_9TREE|nr:hypothetical protein LOC62_02G002680 [Vanrija pseudolonga]